MKAVGLRSVVLAAIVAGCVSPFGASTAYGEELVISPVVIVTDDRTASLPAPRSWYGSTMSLITTYSTASYYFDGNSVGIEMTCSSQRSGTFSVTLYRDVGSGSSQRIGTAAFNRNGFTKATWSGVGSGTYHFVMSKPNDGTRVTSSDVAMYSW